MARAASLTVKAASGRYKNTDLGVQAIQRAAGDVVVTATCQTRALTGLPREPHLAGAGQEEARLSSALLCPISMHPATFLWTGQFQSVLSSIWGLKTRSPYFSYMIRMDLGSVVPREGPDYQL